MVSGGITKLTDFLFAYVDSCNITKTCLYNFDPTKPHFCMVKLWFTGVYMYIIFLISAQKHRVWVLVRGGSNEYPKSVLSRNMNNIKVFLSGHFQVLEVKLSIYLNRLFS